MALNAFNKEIVRSIRKSAGRFAAIAIISLLGAGFYAGLRMAAPDMRIAGDEFFDAANLYDISVMTTLGLDDESLETLADVEGVGAVMPAYRADAMVQAGEGSYAGVVESLPVQAALESDTSDGVHALSDDEGYVNRPLLMEGSWPERDDECVMGIDAAQELGVAIGDTLQVLKSTQDLEDVFAVTSFNVTGYVNSAAYASSSQLGVTTLGTGTVELYLYVPEDAFAEDLPYTVAYLTVPAAYGEQWGTAAYDDAVAPVKARVEDIADDLGTARWNAVHADAQEELDEARADYEEERADAEEELNDALVKLEDAQRELADARGALSSGQSQMASAKRDLDEAKDMLDRSREQLEDARVQLEGSQALLQESERQLQDSRAQLDATAAQLQEAYEQLQALKQLIDAGMADEQLIAQYEAGLAAYQQGMAQYQQGEAAYAAGVQQYEAGLAQYEAGLAGYQDGAARYEQGVAQYEAGVRAYEQARAEYLSGLAQYESGRNEYVSGVADYEEGRVEADEGFADAEKELADAQAEIDDIEKPEVYVTDRSKNYGVAQLSSDADGITQIATYLPFMFFLVAALVSLTSMTRMVDEERMELGTHKALGYGRARITSKYLIYGVLASGLGSVLGVVLLGKLLPLFIMVAYGISYAIPVYPVPLEPASTAKALGLSVGVTAVATWAAASASLREKPAALMLPRVPKAGKRIFLERIRPLWSRMSFSHKVTARNLLRYKRRFFMAVVGIAGCTALLMVGFGLRDAIGGIVSSQYEQLVSYDAAVRLDAEQADEARDQVNRQLASSEVAAYTAVDGFTMIAQGDGDDMRIEVVVPQDPDALPDFVALRDRVSGQELPLQPGQIVLTEKAATTLGVGAGDKVTLFDENQVGDPTGDGRSFTVGGIAENYLGHFAYLLPDGYRSAFGEEPSFDLLYVKLADGADTGAFSERLLDIDGVNTVSFVAEKITTYEGMLDVMNKLIYVIMLLSAALAFVVLYNLTNINIGERIREIATLKVLGFTRSEVSAYIFREIIVMALIGALVGCVLGVPLTFYIAQAAETPQMMFGRSIEPASYVLSFAITMVFAAIVAFTMRGKLNRVNMVESLKSVE